MKAFKCDRCGKFYAYSPVGIFYDNTDSHRGIRYDLCSGCVETVLKDIHVSEDVEDDDYDEGMA